jgi:hypothetical protein
MDALLTTRSNRFARRIQTAMIPRGQAVRAPGCVSSAGSIQFRDFERHRHFGELINRGLREKNSELWVFVHAPPHISAMLLRPAREKPI